MSRRKTPLAYQTLAQDRGFIWLGPEVPNIRTKTGWQCRQGHCWEATYGSLSAGNGCPYCAGLVAKTPADYHVLAQRRGFVWLGPEVLNTATKTGWQCQQGHRWPATYNHIRAGTGCPACAKNAQFGRQPFPKTPADYHALAEKRGFIWLGPETTNISTKTGWQCQQGHRWQARYANIYTGTGCPHCAGLSPKTPTDYHALAKERGFVWLGPKVTNTATKTDWQCDQGHYWEAQYSYIQAGTGCPHCAGLSPKTPADYHALAEKRGFSWLGPEPINTNTKTGWQCQQGHRWQARYTNIYIGRGCPYCAGLVPKTPADYHILAKARGFSWLGPEVPNVITKTRWQCPQEHCWTATYINIRRGTGCPHCAGNARKTPLDYAILAEQRGFSWLGPEVPNVITKTRWQCPQGHCWTATYSNIQAGTGCLACARNARKSFADDPTFKA